MISNKKQIILMLCKNFALILSVINFMFLLAINNLQAKIY